MNLPIYKTHKLPNSIKLTGDYNKAEWQSLPSINFCNSPNGKIAKQKTTAKFGWTDTHLWAIFYAEDTCIKADLTKKHDDIELWTENVVELFLDPIGLGRSYYELQVNCNNVGFDGIVHNASGAVGIGPTMGCECFRDWNPKSFEHIVTGKGKFNNTADKDEYWVTEFKIAFNDLWMIKETPQIGTKWRFNSFRVDTSNNQQELYAWNPSLMDWFHVSELFGIMELVK